MSKKNIFKHICLINCKIRSVYFDSKELTIDYINTNSEISSVAVSNVNIDDIWAELRTQNYSRFDNYIINNDDIIVVDYMNKNYQRYDNDCKYNATPISYKSMQSINSLLNIGVYSVNTKFVNSVICGPIDTKIYFRKNHHVNSGYISLREATITYNKLVNMCGKLVETPDIKIFTNNIINICSVNKNVINFRLSNSSTWVELRSEEEAYNNFQNIISQI